ncbi:unnamed protein product [Ostreobium quekettii]|uniref:G domain-containing protein n=1 Tax=Ostreobium quekettii TaxID=121088 RepID=A0A8S1IV64_9CHLO|nr:unnamed protein product [Ostreobium quekettii]
MRRGRDVYVMGAANVGKSAFVRALLQEMRAFVSTSFDPAARSFGRFLPTESEMPGTTLGIIPLQAFSTGGTLYDTPGVHLFHRVPHILSPGDVRRLHPRKKLRPYVPPTPLTICSGTRVFDDESPVSATYLWGTLARIDVVEAPRDTTLVFYGPQVLKVRSMRLFGVGEVATADDGCEHVKEIDQSNNKDVAPAPGDPGKDVADRQLASAVNPRSGLRQDKDHGTITSIWGSVGEEEVAEVKYVKSQAESELISSISNSLLDAFKESELLLEAGEPHTARPAEAPAGCTKPARSRGPWHEKGSMSTPPGPMFGEASVEMCGGLTLAREVELDCSVLGWRWPDITVSGVPGWISVLVPSGRGRVVLRMWTPRGVEAFIRTPIPVPLPLLNAGRD